MTVFTDKAKVYVPRLMKDLAVKDFQACGIFGNIGGETGGFVALQEKKPTVAGSAGGYGWLMWTGPRRRKFTMWCKAQNMDPASDEANYQYLVKETLTDEAHSLAQLKKTTTLEAATETFMLQNLRPGIPNLQGRIDWIKTTWAKFEAWFNGWFPGFKTYITLGFGIIGSAAATLQQFVTGLPITHYISAETISITTAVLYAL